MVINCDLTRLAQATPAFDKATCESYAAAAAVAVNFNGHIAPYHLLVRTLLDGKESQDTFPLILPPIVPEMKNAWADLSDASEHGAYALALLLAPQVTGHKVLQRSSKGTGFDYWLGDTAVLPFDNKARLEVSGMTTGTLAQVQARIKQKKTQTGRTKQSGLPGYVAVTEFGAPQTHIETV